MRIASWNILSGTAVEPGDAPTLAAAAARLDADVLALQEVDHAQPRSGHAQQTRDAAAAMGAVDWRFGPAYLGNSLEDWVGTKGVLHAPEDPLLLEPHYGIALISRIPVQRWHRIELGRSRVGLPLLHARDGVRRWRYIPDEHHLALAAELANGWTVIATHLSFVPPVNLRQLAILKRWASTFGRKVVILGDLNLIGRLPTWASDWVSAHVQPTYPSWAPRVQFDHILVRPDVATHPLQLAKPMLSDHLPIAAAIDC